MLVGVAIGRPDLIALDFGRDWPPSSIGHGAIAEALHHQLAGGCIQFGVAARPRDGAGGDPAVDADSEAELDSATDAGAEYGARIIGLADFSRQPLKVAAAVAIAIAIAITRALASSATAAAVAGQRPETAAAAGRRRWRRRQSGQQDWAF